jgi:hypothetical protein
MTLSPESVFLYRFGIKDFHVHRKTLAKSGNEAVRMLAVTPQIDTHYLAGFKILDEPAHTVGKTLGIHMSCPGAPSFRKNQQWLFPFEKGCAFIQRLFHLFAIAAPVDGDALGEVTKDCREDIPLEVVSLRQIPGQLTVMQ